MTCIVGITTGSTITMGADSVGSNGSRRTARADKKIFQKGEFLIGFTSSFRMGQLLQFKLEPPRMYPDDDLYPYMVTDFVEAVRNTLRDGGYATVDNGNEKGGTFLIGVRGRLFRIEDDYQVAESLDGFDACGSGETYALGSLYSTKTWGSNAQRVMDALEAAALFSPGVGRPFHVREV